METSKVSTGSHRSNMSEILAQKLNLKVFGEQHVHVSTFGSKNMLKISTKYTQVSIS